MAELLDRNWHCAARAGPPCSLPGQPYSRHTLSDFAGITRISIGVDIDGGLGAQGALLLVILLDARVFVVDVERGGDALREDAGSYPSRVLRVMISWTCSGRPRSRLAVDPRPRTTGACS